MDGLHTHVTLFCIGRVIRFYNNLESAKIIMQHPSKQYSHPNNTEGNTHQT